MKNLLRIKLALLVACLAGISSLLAEPIDFKEVSLMVRSGESEPSITNEVSERKLLRSLTPQQENTLKAQGASNSLVQSLRNSSYIVSKEEAAAYEARREQKTKVAAEQKAPAARWATPSDNVHVFDVACGHPINLSQWGGADYEFAFYSYRFAGEDHIQPVLIDNVRTFTHVSRHIPLVSEDEVFTRNWFPTNAVRNWRYTPHDGRADLRDNRINLSDAVSTSSHSASRAMSIDWNNPVFIKGVPYTLYPVYGARGASLYYISSTGHSVKLAVSTALR